SRRGQGVWLSLLQVSLSIAEVRRFRIKPTALSALWRINSPTARANGSGKSGLATNTHACSEFTTETSSGDLAPNQQTGQTVYPMFESRKNEDPRRCSTARTRSLAASWTDVDSRNRSAASAESLAAAVG